MTGKEILLQLQKIQNSIIENGVDKEYSISDLDLSEKNFIPLENNTRPKKTTEIYKDIKIHYDKKWNEYGEEAKKLWLLTQYIPKLQFNFDNEDKYAKQLGITVNDYHNLVIMATHCLEQYGIKEQAQYESKNPKDMLEEWKNENKDNRQYNLNILECFEFYKGKSDSKGNDVYNRCYVDMKKLVEYQIFNIANIELSHTDFYKPPKMYQDNWLYAIGNDIYIKNYGLDCVPYFEIKIDNSDVAKWLKLTDYGRDKEIQTLYNKAQEVKYSILVTMYKGKYEGNLCKPEYHIFFDYHNDEKNRTGSIPTHRFNGEKVIEAFSKTVEIFVTKYVIEKQEEMMKNKQEKDNEENNDEIER